MLILPSFFMYRYKKNTNLFSLFTFFCIFAAYNYKFNYYG